MKLKNHIFRALLGNVSEIIEQKWTLVPMNLREEFIVLANSFGCYPCGGTVTDDCSAQVFYV